MCVITLFALRTQVNNHKIKSLCSAILEIGITFTWLLNSFPLFFFSFPSFLPNSKESFLSWLFHRDINDSHFTHHYTICRIYKRNEDLLPTHTTYVEFTNGIFSITLIPLSQIKDINRDQEKKLQKQTSTKISFLRFSPK